MSVQLLVLSLALWTSCSTNESFTCFTNETNKVTFADNPTAEVPLPTIRLIQGTYSSQWAMQYVAYVYLSEKIGVNVTMYPDDDPQSFLSLFSSDLLPPSPQFFYSGIAHYEYDFLFQLWDVSTINISYFDITVLDGGATGVITTEGLFVPAYVYHDNPQWIDQEAMRTNETIREMYIDAARNGSRDWISFADATYDKPIAFGSYPGYSFNQKANDTIQNIFEGTWDFVTLGNEGLLSEFVIDLYQRRLPFVAALYSPHRDFVTIINETSSEIMQFEPLELGLNSSYSSYELCVNQGICSSPGHQNITKIANPSLNYTFPEMLDFFTQFTMDVDDVNEIIGIIEEIQPNHTSYDSVSHEMWQFAACQWLKSDKGINTTSAWTVDIIRYDCAYGASSTECSTTTTATPTTTSAPEPCDWGTIEDSSDDCVYYCFDSYLTTGSFDSITTTHPQSRSFAEIKAVCPNIQYTIDHYEDISCSSVADLVWSDSCECPSCPCNQHSDIINYHEIARFFKKECTMCQCTTYNSDGDKAWSCESEIYSVSNPYEWDHFTCDEEISCNSNDPDNYITYSPGETWFESTGFDSSCETFCYCQYDGTTYCETSYEDITSSANVGLRYAFFEECDNAIGCQNDPDLLRGESPSYCGCPDCLCSSGKQDGDVEYVEYEQIHIDTPLFDLNTGDVYCMKCSCVYDDYMDLYYRDCDQDSFDSFDSYLPGTESCPPVSNTQCLNSSSSTFQANNTSTRRILISSGTDVTDCYGSSQTYCGFSGTIMTDSEGNTFPFDDSESDIEFGCQDAIFCDTWSMNDGECYHIDIDFSLLSIAGITEDCDASSDYSAIYQDLHLHSYEMCCTGTNCNDVEVDTTSCTDHSGLQSWVNTYFQCLLGDEYETHFCELRDEITCQDLQSLATWIFGCNCEAFSTAHGLASTVDAREFFTQQFEASIAEMEEWSALFECNLVFSCDLSSGEISVSVGADDDIITAAPTAAPTSSATKTMVHKMILFMMPNVILLWN